MEVGINTRQPYMEVGINTWQPCMEFGINTWQPYMEVGINTRQPYMEVCKEVIMFSMKSHAVTFCIIHLNNEVLSQTSYLLTLRLHIAIINLFFFL